MDDLNYDWGRRPPPCGSGMIENTHINLLSGGFFRCDPAWSRAAGTIDRCYKVYFPVSGSARLEMADSVFDLEADRIYFISGFRLSRQLCDASMEVYWLHFVPEALYLRHVLDQLPPVISWPRTAKGWPASSFADLRGIFKHSFTEQHRPRRDLSAAIVCRLSALLLNLVAHCLEGMDEDKTARFNPDFFRLKPTLDFMNQHGREPLALSQMAAVAGMAPNHFHRRFKAVFGVTPFAYLLGQRLNQARHLLASTQLTVKEIAGAVGYADPLYFTRIFSRQLRLSPTQYRTTHQFNSVSAGPAGEPVN